VLEEPAYLEAAEGAAAFVLKEARDAEGRLCRSWRNGTRRHAAVLEDYACLASGLLALGGEARRKEARELLEEVETRFRDPHGGYYQTAEDAATLWVRQRDPFDGATPSAVGTAMGAWADLGETAIVERIAGAFEAAMARSPQGTQSLWRAVDWRG